MERPRRGRTKQRRHHRLLKHGEIRALVEPLLPHAELFIRRHHVTRRRVVVIVSNATVRTPRSIVMLLELHRLFTRGVVRRVVVVVVVVVVVFFYGAEREWHIYTYRYKRCQRLVAYQYTM